MMPFQTSSNLADSWQKNVLVLYNELTYNGGIPPVLSVRPKNRPDLTQSLSDRAENYLGRNLRQQTRPCTAKDEFAMTDIDLPALAARVEAGEIKALSIKQPYPHHIFHNGKDVENRDWPTKGRGWIIIHAGVSKTELDMDDPKEADMPRGGVVGMARITDCVQEMDSRWFFGRYGFVLRDAFPLPLVACRGQLGFFKPPADVLATVAAEIARLQPRSEGGV